MKRLIQIMALLLLTLVADAQVTVRGIVTDLKGRPLSQVNVSADGRDIHTVTNEDGMFSLKILEKPRHIKLSHIGFKTRRIALEKDYKEEVLRIRMEGSTVELDEVLVSANDPMSILKAAMERVKYNYPQKPELMRCFYRETARRGSRFISVAEAVTEMYKSSYAYGPGRDGVAILKGRRLMSMKAKDTLGVKIQGGPVLPIMVDVAKNPEYIMNPENLLRYKLRMEVPIKIADRPQYVINMESRGSVQLNPLVIGKVFVDQETLTFTRAELQLDMTDWRLASDYMLVRKPFGLRFRPKELSVVIVYETDEAGVCRMSYVRNEMRFNCDWKKRLFASPFTTVCEMVVTDRNNQSGKIKRPRGRSSFSMHDRFYDRVEYFDDPHFWADYNIIEPTESLEKAIDKLKKKVRNNK